MSDAWLTAKEMAALWFVTTVAATAQLRKKKVRYKKLGRQHIYLKSDVLKLKLSDRRTAITEDEKKLISQWLLKGKTPHDISEKLRRSIKEIKAYINTLEYKPHLTGFVGFLAEYHRQRNATA